MLKYRIQKKWSTIWEIIHAKFPGIPAGNLRIMDSREFQEFPDPESPVTLVWIDRFYTNFTFVRFASQVRTLVYVYVRSTSSWRFSYVRPKGYTRLINSGIATFFWNCSVSFSEGIKAWRCLALWFKIYGG